MREASCWGFVATLHGLKTSKTISEFRSPTLLLIPPQCSDRWHFGCSRDELEHNVKGILGIEAIFNEQKFTVPEEEIRKEAEIALQEAKMANQELDEEKLMTQIYEVLKVWTLQGYHVLAIGSFLGLFVTTQGNPSSERVNHITPCRVTLLSKWILPSSWAT